MGFSTKLGRQPWAVASANIAGSCSDIVPGHMTPFHTQETARRNFKNRPEASDADMLTKALTAKMCVFIRVAGPIQCQGSTSVNNQC
ncbi:hypothetical protein Plhal304r1_c022g0077531 [Plasmopara halstedii]